MQCPQSACCTIPQKKERESCRGIHRAPQISDDPSALFHLEQIVQRSSGNRDGDQYDKDAFGTDTANGQEAEQQSILDHGKIAASDAACDCPDRIIGDGFVGAPDPFRPGRDCGCSYPHELRLSNSGILCNFSTHFLDRRF